MLVQSDQHIRRLRQLACGTIAAEYSSGSAVQFSKEEDGPQTRRLLTLARPMLERPA